MMPTRVGLIDDETQALKMFQWEFGEQFEVYTFISGEDALVALADGLVIDVLISDQRMPKMPGDSVLVAIRQRFPDIQLLITTAFADVEPLRRCVNEAGVYGYIEKPWKPDLIVKMVEEARAKQLQKELENTRTQAHIKAWEEKTRGRRIGDIRSICNVLELPETVADKYLDVVTKVASTHTSHWTDVGLLSESDDDRIALDFLRACQLICAEEPRHSNARHTDSIPLVRSMELITRCSGPPGPSFDVTKEEGRLTVNFDACGAFGDSYLDPLSARDQETLFRNALLLLALAEMERVGWSLTVDPREDRLMGSVTFPT